MPMRSHIRTDYRAVNKAGTVLYTFGDETTGRRWVRENACRHDGLRLEAVEVFARRVYVPRAPKADPFAIPAMS